MLAPAAKRMERWEKGPAQAHDVLAWEVASTPRLKPSDLSDPTVFYRRLEDWLMKQK
jgi:hypothetical protein